MRRALALVAVLGVAALSWVACSDEAEPGQSGSGGTSITPPATSGGGQLEPACGDLGDTFLDEACRACVHDSCCDELAACDADDACAARYGCEAGCVDQACIDACSPSSAEATAALDCVAAACDSVCDGPSRICDTSISSGTAACDQCLGDNCCTALNACLADATCGECFDSGDAGPCAGLMLYDDTMQCFANSCASSCDG